MAGKRYQSWGRYPKVEQRAIRYCWRDDHLPLEEIGIRQFLPFGNGRSYGDVCLNDGGMLLDCRELNRFIGFDPGTGVLRCEAGVLLAEILRLSMPQGWFLPVTPGTRFVTVGGAIANDVHGKNHHRAGTFGRHVLRFELLRSDGVRRVCSREKNSDYFDASIGGLGLTGVITWAEIQLKAVTSPYIDQEIIRYRSLDEFFALARESDHSHEYTVAWVDCLAKGKELGRGLFMRGNHVAKIGNKPPKTPTRRFTFPLDPPFALINGLTLKLFNTLYYRGQFRDRVRRSVHYESFFYPLDALYAWNRVYGSRGFLQYQCAVPADKAGEAVGEILKQISAVGSGSFLAVLKLFGDRPSPGLLSFPLPGATLALDFPNNGNKTFRLLDRLDAVTRVVGGRVNPSKDARMSAPDFQAGFPAWSGMEAFLDPGISSGFWRRVTAKS